MCKGSGKFKPCYFIYTSLLYEQFLSQIQTLLQTTFIKQHATHLYGIVQTFCYLCAQICFKLYQNVNINHLASQYFKQLTAMFIKLLYLLRRTLLNEKNFSHMLYCVNYALLTWNNMMKDWKWDVGLGNCKTEVVHANVHRLLWLFALMKIRLFIKSNIAKYYPSACFLAHKQPDGEFKKLKSWNDLIKSSTSKLSFLSVW